MESSNTNPSFDPPSHNAVIVRPLVSSTPHERENILRDVEYNVFAFPAGLVTCDFLSDSGTSAMTDLQWAALMRADESYGRNWGYYCLLDAFRDVFERGSNGAKHVFRDVLVGIADSDYYRGKLLQPCEGGFVNGGSRQLEHPNFFIVPQGRCAEFLLFSTFREMILETPKENLDLPPIAISNGFFDTTAANATASGFEIHNFVQTAPKRQPEGTNPFLGNLDVAAAEAFMDKHPGQVKLILITITNNWAAAQPVSMRNIKEAAELGKHKGVPVFFDACRFAENSWFIRNSEFGYADKQILDIIKEMFSYVDGFTISLKKDGLSNMGGVLCFRDNSLFAQQYTSIGHRLKQRQILCYGNDSYGGMSGRDLMTATAGLFEVTKETYLCNRISQVQSFAQKLSANNLPVVLPAGGHAIYLDMGEFFHGCNRQLGEFPAVGFTLELLKEYGIRAFEAGPFAWEWDQKSVEEREKIPNLVRFAVPRHVFSDAHIDYTVAAIKALYDRRHSLPNVKITRGQDMMLRHFSCGMKPVPVEKDITATNLSEAKAHLAQLSRATGQDEVSKSKLLHALLLVADEWSQAMGPQSQDQFHWQSLATNKYSPLEYSVVLDQATGEAELGLQFMSHPTGYSQSQIREWALHLNEAILIRHGAMVSLDVIELVRDILLQKEAGNTFTASHNCAVRKTGIKWEICLTPCASHKHEVLASSRTVFERLGMAYEWDLVERSMATTDSVAYISLDLVPTNANAQVEVFIAHEMASAKGIASMHEAICTNTCTFEIQRFCESIAGSLGPYTSKAPMSSFAFTSVSGDRSSSGTIYLPVDAYANNDNEIQERVERYMTAKVQSPIFAERYRKSVGAVQRRPLAQRCGLHSWVSLEQSVDGSLSNAFSFSAETPEGTNTSTDEEVLVP
ncbi:beta-eliminating lyase [Astrocystis sublimbata]|nr:beta-eliminating lyase [Astrocystis sublimbata]